MRATVWSGRNKVSVENVPDPKILNARDAIVKISSTAICGSDLHLYDGYVPTMRKGDILGHEFMGEIVETGGDVTNLKVGDRVVVPFPIACGACNACAREMFSLCENSNPNASTAEKLWGDSTCGIFGYSHAAGGYAGGQSEYARVPFADVGPIKIESDLSDEQALFLSDVFPTGYMGAELCDIKPGDIVAVWGCGPVGQFAIASAYLLGAERVIAIDRFDYRLTMAREKSGAETINYEQASVREALREMTGGRGPDACIDCVGLEAHHHHGGMYAYDRVKQATRMETERGYALREAIFNCRNGGTVSIMGVYGGFMDKFPIGAVMNRGLTIKTGQCHVHRYLRPLLQRIEKGDIDPSFIVTHRMSLDDASTGYETFKHKQDECVKVVMTP
ncbi:MAG: glutathione-dependent formaldehyde dehydrogenase [Actinobacteria bacterium]|nr:glutathione-dependent formaldehyde dehydrogenase [Actinomycetota bacterium]